MTLNQTINAKPKVIDKWVVGVNGYRKKPYKLIDKINKNSSENK
jgi:hypothetical protein